MARLGDWKLLNASGFGRESFTGSPKFELYDLSVDPLEQNDLAASTPKTLARLRSAYDAWFDDVGGTRPDNYAPPRIITGTKHEPVTTLTRQDWRHTTGRPWQRDSRGYWLLKSEVETSYDVVCRFSGSPKPSTVVLTVSGKLTSQLQIPADATSCVFPDVTLPSGDFRVEVTINEKTKMRGVHQVDVSVK